MTSSSTNAANRCVVGPAQLGFEDVGTEHLGPRELELERGLAQRLQAGVLPDLSDDCFRLGPAQPERDGTAPRLVEVVGEDDRNAGAGLG